MTAISIPSTFLMPTVSQKQSFSAQSSVGAMWLIDAARQCAIENKELYAMTNVHWAREMGSISLRLPRGMGNTTIALQAAERYQPSIVLVPYNQQAVIIKKRFKEKGLKIPVSTLDSFHKMSGKNFDDKTVIVDDVSNLEKDNLNLIFSLGAKFYILLG